MKIKSFLKHKLQYLKWRVKNLDKSFADYYVYQVNSTLKKDKVHPTLGKNIKNESKFYRTAEIEKKILIQAGLKPTHRIVDYGCGSLRIGEALIPYLNKGNYIGLDKEETFFNEGKKRLPDSLLKEKAPIFKTISDNNLKIIQEMGIDMVFSGSVLYHVPKKELKNYLENIISLTKPGGKIIIDFLESDQIKKRSWATWEYPSELIVKHIKEINLQLEFRISRIEDEVYTTNRRIIEINIPNE